MKAYTILHENSVQFLWHDLDFAEMLMRLSHESHGSAFEHPTPNPEDNAHYVEQLLSPLVVSSQILQNTFEDPINVITCNEAGCNIVFQYYDDCYYVGFCGNEQFAVYNMKKELHVLREIAAFYLGPCRKSINPRNGIDRSRTWSKIYKAVESFIELHKSEASFLVGGIEKLHFNTDVQQNCSKIIEKAMDSSTKNLRKGKYFGILLVKNKIAAYEAGPKMNFVLSTGDILRVITACNSKFKQVDDIDTVEASSAVDATDFSLSDDSDATSSNSNSFSPIRLKTPTRLKKSATLPKRKASMNPKMRARLFDLEKSSSLPRSGFFGQEKVRFSCLDENDEERSLSEDAIFEATSENSMEDPGIMTRPSLRSRRTTMSDFRIVEETVGIFLSHDGIHTMPVFLKSVECEFTPFLMHTMRISDDVNFVLLTEVKHVDIATTICRFISLLKKIEFKGDTSPNATKGSLILSIEGGTKTYDKLTDCCKDLKSKLGNVEKDRQVRRIVATWEKTVSPTLRDFLSQKKIHYLDKLERNITELSLMLQTLFQQIFLTKPRSKSAWREKLTNLALELKMGLTVGGTSNGKVEPIYFSNAEILGSQGAFAVCQCIDHLEFYRAKAMRNLSISRSYENYPGLLHFVLVRRWKKVARIASVGSIPILMDEVHTSGLYIPEESELGNDRLQVGLQLCLKKQVWRGVLSAYGSVAGQEGVSHFSIIEGDYKSTSFFWTRSAETVTLPLANQSLNGWNGSSTLSGFESLFGGNWMKCSDKIEGRFLFMELHLVHFSTVPDSTITIHANTVLNNFRFNKYDV